MNELLDNLVTYGYVILFFYSLGGGFFALAAAGVLASLGRMDPLLAIAVAFVANFLGDQGLLLFARSNRHAVMEYLKKHRRKLAYAHLLMKRYGTWVIFLQKYIYGVKTLVPIAIGLTRYDAWRFALYNLLASALWAVTIGGVSYLGGRSLLSVLEQARSHPWILPLVGGLFLAGLALLFVKGVKKRS